MKTIWKYEIKVKDWQIIRVPHHALWLHIACQDEKMCAWLLVNESHQVEYVGIRVFGTGHDIGDKPGLHRGTVLIDGFVWHVFSDK